MRRGGFRDVTRQRDGTNDERKEIDRHSRCSKCVCSGEMV